MEKDKTNIRKKFKNALKRGTGETNLIVKSNPDMDFSNDILKAGLLNYAFDRQVEESRAQYIFELIQMSNKKEMLIQSLLDALQGWEEDSDYDIYQLFDISALSAKNGNENARKIIYNKFTEFLKSERYYYMGEEAILCCDGFEGLKYIAEAKGKILFEDDEYWVDDSSIDFLQSYNHQINVYEELEKLSAHNKYIKKYFDKAKQNKFGKSKTKRSIFNYQTVVDRINKNRRISPLPPARVKDLSDNDIIKLAEDFQKSNTRYKKERYIRVFSYTPYPFDYHDLLNEANRPYSTKDNLISWAVTSLQHFKNQDIRKFALEKLNTHNPHKYLYTDLLINNYEDGDSKLLLQIVNEIKDEIKIYFLAMSYIDIFEKNTTEDCKKPLIALYNKVTCSSYRCDIVELLLKNNVLPDWVEKEIKYDCSISTRSLTR